MRICVVAHLFPARSETFVLEHVMGLVERGFDVTVVAKDYDRNISAREMRCIDEAGVKRIYVGSFTSFSTKVTNALNFMRAVGAVLRRPSMYGVLRNRAPWAIRELLIADAIARRVIEKDFDLVHVHFGDLGARLQLVASCYSTFPKLVITWHGSDANAIPKKLGEGVYAPLFASDAHHTVGTQFLFERLLQLGARGPSFSRIPMGTDVSRFSYAERSFDGAQPFRVLSVGRLDKVKGHDVLIDAIALLKGRGHDVHLRIGGEGPMRAALVEKIAALGLKEDVDLLGAIDSDAVIREMHAAHLFVLSGCVTSSGKVENQGVVLQEAQATGLPVVASRAGGVPESVLDGKTGFLCEPGNVEEICCAIERFIQDGSLLKSFGKNGRENIEANFSHEGMHSRMAALYSELLGCRNEAVLH